MTQNGAAKVARGATYLYGQVLFSNFVNIIYYAYASRILSQTDLGVIAGLSMIVGLFTTVGSFALPYAATRYIAQYLGKGQKASSISILKKLCSVGILCSIGFSMFNFITSEKISFIFLGSTSYQSLLSLISMDIFTTILTTFILCSLSGFQEFGKIALIDSISAIIRSGLAMMLLGLGWGLMGAVIGGILSNLLRLIIYLTIIIKILRTSLVNGKTGSIHDTISLRDIFKYSLPIYASDIILYISGQADKYIILFFPGLAELGIYNIAIAASSIVILSIDAVDRALFPKMAEQFGKGKEVGLRSTSRMATRYIALIHIPMALGFASISYPLLNLLVGPKYTIGYLPLAIICIASALSCLRVVIGSVGDSLGVTRIGMEGKVIGTIAGIGLSLYLVVPPMSLGMVGAALGRGIVMILPFVYLIIRLKKFKVFDVDYSALRNAWAASVVMAVGVILIQAVFMRTFLLPLYIALGVIIYLVMLKVLNAITPRDFSLIENYIPFYLQRLIKILRYFISPQGQN